jgi:hypothetical protein
VRRLLVLLVAVLAASLTATLISRPGAASTSTRFRTPDAAAACRVEGAALVCSSLASAGSVALRSHGGAKIVRELPWWDAGTPVLRSFHRGPLSCTLSQGGIACRNAAGAIRVDADGFAVAT